MEQTIEIALHFTLFSKKQLSTLLFWKVIGDARMYLYVLYDDKKILSNRLFLKSFGHFRTATLSPHGLHQVEVIIR